MSKNNHEKENQTIMNTTPHNKTAVLHILAAAAFSCERTCTPGHPCRFTPILSRIGRTQVVSHTVSMNVEFRDHEALAEAATRMGGTVLGAGQHRLYAGVEDGFGFTLPKWRYALVLRPDNTLAFDDYHGSWGNTADIKTLGGHYSVAVAQKAATDQGWMSEVQANGSLLVYHPDGGTLTVGLDGTVDASGFVGTGCDAAASPIQLAIGSVRERNDKPEYFGESAHVRN